MSTAVLNLVTGINGSGKTLFLLQHVEQLREKESREVYYWGIRGLKEAGVLPWHEIAPMDESGMALEVPDPMVFHQLPQNAIIVVDEAHAVFPRGGMMQREEPAYIKAFATSRWRGHTFFLCTQDGADLNLFVRRRIGKHYHMIRAFGLDRATRYEWERYARVDSTAEQRKGLSYEFPFPTEVYGWYKSADQHAVRRQLPVKVLRQSAFALVLCVALAVFVWWRLHTAALPDDAADVGASAVQQAAPPGAPTGALSPVDPTLAPASEGPAWLAQFVERVDGQPLSPRFYDAALKPRTFPKISGCMELRGGGRYVCKCNTQQGTIITSTTPAVCRYYLANGWFDFSRSDDDEGKGRSGSSAVVSQPSVSGSDGVGLSIAGGLTAAP
jgi:zona occludens toxin